MRWRPFLLVAIVAACGGSAPSPPDPKSCEADPDPRCENPIDRVLIPSLRALEVPLVDAPGDELCRRLYIDLIDRGPTLAERNACLEDPYEGTVDRLLADPAHERTWRARWSEVLGYNLYLEAIADVVDLDARVGAMDRGELAYADFAAAVAWHPAFWALHKDDSWAEGLFTTFLGRPARADEVAGLRPLTRIWQQRIYAEGHYWYWMYKRGLATGLDEAGATEFANRKASGGAKADWGINLCGCGGGEGTLGCTSDTLGAAIRFEPACNADLAEPYRTRDFTPGQHDECPDGSHRAECADRITDFMSGYTPIRPWPSLDEKMHEDLDGIGRALAARGDFWDAAVDRELRWLLGWWQATFVRPDSDLPAVRAVLASALRTGAPPREIDRLVVTSLLYRLPATPPPVTMRDRLPPWAMGPTKLLAGEGWLRAAATAVGETVAPCDHRFVVRGGWNAAYVDPRLVAREPSSLDSILGTPRNVIDASIALGGCDSDTLRPVVSNLAVSYTQGELARPLCAYGQGVLPPGWDGTDLGVAVEHLAASILSRRVGDAERSELVEEMRACRTSGTTEACTDDASAVRWMCRRMLDSVEFGTY